MTGWSQDRRVRQAAAIQKWRPWEKSTGPRTAEGRARSARNAYRGGQRQRFRQFVQSVSAGLRTDRVAAGPHFNCAKELST